MKFMSYVYINHLEAELHYTDICTQCLLMKYQLRYRSLELAWMTTFVEKKLHQFKFHVDSL